MSKPTSKFDKMLLEGFPWPQELSTGTTYRRLHDDHDGRGEGKLIVTFSADGDAWVWTDQHQGPSLRFRSPIGGTHSPRVRNALILLALAIKLDGDNAPD